MVNERRREVKNSKPYASAAEWRSYSMKVSIFGAGTMGRGIAQAFATHGDTVLLYASSKESAEKHRAQLDKQLQKRVEKGKMTEEDKNAIMSRILVEDEAASADSDLIIESVAEDMAAKTELFGRLDKICKPGSGLSEEDFRRSIACGISKVNIFTDINEAAGKAAEHVIREGKTCLTDMIPCQVEAVAEAVKAKIRIFGSELRH